MTTRHIEYELSTVQLRWNNGLLNLLEVRFKYMTNCKNRKHYLHHITYIWTLTLVRVLVTVLVCVLRHPVPKMDRSLIDEKIEEDLNSLYCRAKPDVGKKFWIFEIKIGYFGQKCWSHKLSSGTLFIFCMIESCTKIILVT